MPSVLIVNAAVVAPAGIVIDGGTEESLVLFRLHLIPPVGAGLLRMIVPVALLPAITDVGLTVRPVNKGVKTVIAAV